jgi:hypothetical protein
MSGDVNMIGTQALRSESIPLTRSSIYTLTIRRFFLSALAALLA